MRLGGDSQPVKVLLPSHWEEDIGYKTVPTNHRGLAARSRGGTAPPVLPPARHSLGRVGLAPFPAIPRGFRLRPGWGRLAPGQESPPEFSPGTDSVWKWAGLQDRPTGPARCAKMHDLAAVAVRENVRFSGCGFRALPTPPRRPRKTRPFRDSDPSGEGAHTPAHTPIPQRSATWRGPLRPGWECVSTLPFDTPPDASPAGVNGSLANWAVRWENDATTPRTRGEMER